MFKKYNGFNPYFIGLPILIVTQQKIGSSRTISFQSLFY